MSFGRRASGTLLATGLAATMGLGTSWSAHAMESTLADQARVTLEARQPTASVLFAGRDATVWADSPSAREDAIAALRTIPVASNSTATGRALNRRVDVTMNQES